MTFSNSSSGKTERRPHAKSNGASDGDVCGDSETQPDDVVNVLGYRLPRFIAYTYVLSVAYNVTFFLQLSALPFVVKRLSISDANFGYLQTLFGVLQMVGGPAFGYIIQHLGIRSALVVCYLSTLASGLSLYFAMDLTTLLLSRIPVLFMHGQQGHQTLLSALTQPGKQRTEAFGRMGLTFGVGFVLTPIISMLSTKFLSELAPLYVSALLCFFPTWLLLNHIPESATTNKDNLDEKPAMTVSSMIRVLQRPGVLNVMVKKNIPIVPCLLIFSVLHLYMIEKFNTTSEEGQIVQFCIGIFIMFSNGFGVIWMRRRFDEQALLKIGTAVFILAFSLFAFFVSTWSILFIMPFLSLGMSIVATVGDSLLTALVHESEQGLVLGTASSLNSLVRTMAPMFAGNLLQSFGFGSIPALGVLCSSVGLILTFVAPVDESLLRRPTHEKTTKAE